MQVLMDLRRTCFEFGADPLPPLLYRLIKVHIKTIFPPYMYTSSLPPSPPGLPRAPPLPLRPDPPPGAPPHQAGRGVGGAGEGAAGGGEGKGETRLVVFA